ncbi:uncharacterized protein EAE98_012116 [Botrytis deweyae]|uniref:Uncharacterized protein n=1 Tax=Botrytis deweyae TaxID=2478750 RepID=A0ABQ7I3U1_9HELO|nr:uncharacterized protein EAE98_012116 [Botrytis deweyae]KAF7910299.1 hypothetical protein EAE98_012116 [Botrytis deweyae]
MSFSGRDINDYSDEEDSPSNSNFLPAHLLEGNLFHSSDTSTLLAVTGQEGKSGSAIKVVVPQPALPKQFPGQGPEFQQYPGQGPEFQHVPGQGPEFQQYPGQGPEFQQYPGQGPEFQQYPGQGPEFQQYPGQGPEFQHVPGQGPEFQQYPGQGPEFQHVPGPGPESPKVANEVEMTDVGNPTEEPAPESLKPVAPAPEKTDKKVDDKAWCGPCKDRTGNGFAGHWTKSCPFAAESGFMEACARCGNLDHCVSFCPRLTWNGKKPVKIKDLYFYLVTCRKGLPPAIAEVDPRVIDPERWEKEVDYPQTPELARQRRQGVLNGTQPEKCDLNLWNELEINTGLTLGLQIHPAHAPGGEHRCCDALWYHPSQTQESTGSASQAEQPSRKSKAGKDTTDSILHGTVGGRIAKISRQEILPRGRGFGRGRGIASRGGGYSGEPDQAQPAYSPPLPSQDEYQALIELENKQAEERRELMSSFRKAHTKRQIPLTTMSAHQPGPVGGLRGARFGGDAVPRRGGHGLDYPGHLPSRGRGGAPTRGYLGNNFLTRSERRARALQSGSQTFGQGGQSRQSRQSLPPGLPALNFGEQGLLQRSARPAQAQGGQNLPAGSPSSTFGAQGTPHQNPGNPGGAPNQQ